MSLHTTKRNINRKQGSCPFMCHGPYPSMSELFTLTHLLTTPTRIGLSPSRGGRERTSLEISRQSVVRTEEIGGGFNEKKMVSVESIYTHPPIYLPSYLSTCLLACLPTYPPTYLSIPPVPSVPETSTVRDPGPLGWFSRIRDLPDDRVGNLCYRILDPE